MDFSQPFWILVGLGVCFGLVLYFRSQERQRQAALEKFVAHQLIGRLTGNISPTRRLIKKSLIVLAVLFCFVALARPQFGHHWVEVQRKGIDLLFALDTSKSMLAEDIKPNRLQRATLAIQDFVRKGEGDRVGLMPFAGTAYLMCPLTIDYEAFIDSLTAVNTDLIPLGGTNIAAVIERAGQTLKNAANHKILIILTDGENLQGDALQAAETAAKDGLTIYTVGVGTSQGELIPIKGDKGQGFITDTAGNFVTSKLDAASLGQIAEKTGGIYVPLGSAGEGLETIYQKKLSLIPKDTMAERRHKVPIERFEWPLAMAALLLLIERLIGERKVNLSLPLLPWAKTLIHRFKGRSKVTALILLMVASFPGNGYASSGEDAYMRGDYLQASEYFQKRLAKKPDDPQLQYNYGTAAYKNNLYDEAIAAFTSALKSDRLDLQKKAYYNRGNSHYQKGAELRQADPKATANHWRQALNSFNSALELDPADADAKYNQGIVTKQLEELEQQLKQQEQEKQQQPKGQDDQKKLDDQQGQTKDDTSGDGQENDQGGGQASAGEQQPEKSAGEDQVKPGEQQAEEQAGQKDSGDSQEQKEQQAEAAAAQEDKDKAEATMRQQLGKMTKEEAERLLNALKNEEGNLNFVPSGQKKAQDKIDKDW
ncbi:MAG: VWA domain-containing protein [Desulforhopalus sp.]|nr:VWA domain-containing protein [Desulforhopalus sp.]